jgi:subtilase family serine protease
VKYVAAAALTALLTGCGSGDSPTSVTSVATQDVALSLKVAADSDLSSVQAAPTFHVAPVLLAEPADIDSSDPAASATVEAHTQTVPDKLQYLSTRKLTLEALRDAASGRVSVEKAGNGDDIATPMATGTVVTTYSPAQIRAAYGLPALPPATAAPTAQQAAQMGAGQTIYIVDASSDPNVNAELAFFSQKFGLPGCVSTTIATTANLPLASAPISGCTLSVVYNTSTGAMTSTVPAYDSGWHTEIALDVQWAHAIAPMARIIVINAPDASLNSLLGAVTLANRMGPGVVSMSFGANEGTWTSAVDSNFATANMTYLAATGDSGTAVSWPAVSTRVLAVGGTSLTYTPGSTRSEVAWSSAGGGVSAYTTKPSYQTTSVPGMGSYANRGVSDVSMNADPATGQYVAVITPGTTVAGWLSAGGTSLSTPQWAGLIAIANAQRSLAAKSIIGQPHTLLYGQIATTKTTYASSFADIAAGSNGSCATCLARTGWDSPTGLGSPNATSLLASLSGTTATPIAAPVVASGSITGTSGIALTFTASASAPNAVSFSLSGAPSGMTISSTGVATWLNPVAGSYWVTITALDIKTGLTGSGSYSITIVAPQPPVVTGSTIKGTAGAPLSFTIAVSASRPVSYSLSGAPSGMSVSTTGTVTWQSPVVGTYSITAKATDATTGLAGTGLYTVTIAAPTPPVVAAASIRGVVGSALSFSVSVSAANPVSFALNNAPGGMTVSSAGIVSWPTPAAGTYAVTVVATDNKTALVGKGVYTVAISPAGPVIQAAPIAGVAGVALSGTITITDATSSYLSVTISAPAGMAFSISGSTITASWAKPVTGTYTMRVSAIDGNGRSATANVPITVNAR